MTIYTFPEPFECFRHGRRGWVTAYLDDSFFVWVSEDGCHSCVGISSRFDPPPPVPVAARRPKVGEVWMRSHWATPALLIYHDGRSPGNWATSTAEGGLGTCIDDWLTRPATPEEAEPFRPLLEGLKASLGEG